ncbi:putative dehydratase [Caenibius tardaugens NBRC 16725]|uniref:Putative dehydratase n=1 Tax=Caenibius tardaugens NBRC 16725 TaxID=1219035 RepID=U2YL89_9SPHN|nr:nuclear transport factor 2 family protein [Caenibius tardaugens]AZI36510.1 nuclear transport factor 2 family protein [Caenibius tardaugens NBRC 16725]GAD49147.1 putative dehydratase [Caenibius tardaugens NBRC 16725]
MDSLERLEAIAAITALKARYFHTMDTKDWAGLEAVFAPDLVADFRDATETHDPSQLTHGAAPYVAKLAPILQDVVTVHHGHTPEITIESSDSARGVWAMEDKLWPRETSQLPFRMLHGYGHYHERYIRIGGEWRIAEIRLSRLRVDAA